MFGNKQDVRFRRRIQTGDVLPAMELRNIHSELLSIPDKDRLVHLQFRRFAGCPICNLHLQSIIRRHREIASASIREVVVFHSTVKNLLPHAAGLPFDVIADPRKRLYTAFGVESSPRALLDPHAWWPTVRAVSRSLLAVLRKREPLPPVNPEGGSLSLPADFLIASDGHVVALKYGVHAYDQWTVDEILATAARAGAIRERVVS